MATRPKSIGQTILNSPARMLSENIQGDELSTAGILRDLYRLETEVREFKTYKKLLRSRQSRCLYMQEWKGELIQDPAIN